MILLFKYAQIDISTGKCVCVSYLSGEVEADFMIPLTELDDVEPNDIFSDGAWTRPDPPPFEPPTPTPEQIRIEKLEEQLAITNATVDFLLGI